MSVCERCGTPIIDQDEHDEWCKKTEYGCEETRCVQCILGDVLAECRQYRDEMGIEKWQLNPVDDCVGSGDYPIYCMCCDQLLECIEEVEIT